MDKEMIERCMVAARARRYELINMPLERCYEDIVKAVIKAMREPTEKMLEEGAWVPTCGEIVGHSVAKQCWGEMLDAITGEGA